jgi:N-acetylmuramoyl-L-alanine amidase
VLFTKEDKVMLEIRKGLLVTALILLAGNPYWMTLNAQELADADRTLSSTDTTLTESVGLPAIVSVPDEPAVASSAVVQGAFEGDPIPVVPFEDIGSPASTEEVTASSSISVDEAEAVEVEDESPSFFDKVWNYLGATADTTVERGKLYLEKRRVQSLYGEVNATEENLATILAQEKALKEADAIRQQREFDMMVLEAERQRLYEESLLCLALNGYYEARSETADQEVATAAVVLNRLSVGFRDATTICEVITTPAQFSWVATNGMSIPDTGNKFERKAWERSLLIAKRMLDPDATYIDPSNGAIYYYNPSIVDWKYKKAYNQVSILGNHRFMTEKKGHKYYINNMDVRINPVLFNGLSHTERDALKNQFQPDSNGV